MEITNRTDILSVKEYFPKWEVGYNEYFRTHDSLGDTGFERLDCGKLTPAKVAERVLEWLIKEKQ